jgi:CheY-like chemotaxis protein
MNAIMGFSSLLANYYDDKPKLEEFSRIIGLSCNDLLEMINDILDIARIESGQESVNNQEFRLKELFAELTPFFTELRKRIKKLEVELDFQPHDPEEFTIFTDKVKLKQIFINLIDNAYKFTEKGKIEAGYKFDSNNKLIFYVTDTGIGIPADKYNTIFERFAQLNQDKKKLFRGTGLGLSIVKGLIDLLKGEIHVESELEKGTAFYFSIPYKIAQTVHNASVMSEENKEYDFTGKTILVIEDDVFNAAYIKEVLSKTGLNILHTEFGQEAVQIATTQPLDMVLMDIRLPDISGYEATRRIRQQKPFLTIIAVTAFASQEDRQKAIVAGCDDYISKPLDRNLLLSKINNLMIK